MENKQPKRLGEWQSNNKTKFRNNPPTINQVKEKLKDKLKDKEELFPEANQRTKEMIENSNIKDITD
jgi:hypothetical protein